jgi:hypothetical protein
MYFINALLKECEKKMPKQIAATAVEGIRKRGGPSRRWRDEVEEDLNVMGMDKTDNVRIT